MTTERVEEFNRIRRLLQPIPLSFRDKDHINEYLDAAANAILESRKSDVELVEALKQARLQFEYLDGRFPTGTTPSVLTKINQALAGRKVAE